MGRVTAREVADVLEAIAPPVSGIEGDELGFIYGDPQAPVSAVACMWNAHSSSIRRAEARQRRPNKPRTHVAPARPSSGETC